ncbi:MAG: AMP-binding protein, partial [Thermoanaerobaculia bacterium]
MSFRPPERFNIADYFLDQRVAEGRGDRIALRLDDRQMTYDEVLALANLFGQVLLRIGVRPQERVLIALPDGPDFVGSLFGILKIGAVVVMVNPSLEPEALAGLFDYSRARVAVVDAGVLPSFEEAIDIAAWKPGLLVVGNGEHSHRSFGEEQQKVEDKLDTAPTHRNDPAIWLFSGGTTGRPKAVVQTHTSFANTTECYAKTALGYREDDITLSVPKLFFGYATGSNLFFPFSVGASAVLYPEHPTTEVVFERIRRHRPTILVNVPTMINRMVQHPDASSQDLSSLRFATSAGEALPAPLYRSWRQTFGVEL